MKPFRVTYRYTGDTCCPDFTTTVQASDREGAEFVFWSSCDDAELESYEIVRVEAISQHPTLKG